MNAQGRFPLHDLIGTFPFDQTNDAVAARTSGRIVKPVLTFDEF